MTEERENLQSQAVEAIENEIRMAQAVQEERLSFMDRFRRGCDRFTCQSAVGSWLVRIVSALTVFLSLYASVRHGLATDGSLIRDAAALLAAFTAQSELLLAAAVFLISLTWLATPTPGVVLCAAVLYMSFGGMAPVALLLAALLLLFFQLEDRPVAALLVALPALTFLTPLKIGLFVVVMCAFLSTRRRNGVVRSLGLVYFAVLELCRGTFGTLHSSRGTILTPLSEKGVHPLVRVKNCFSLLESGEHPDPLFGQVLLLLAIFFVIGSVYARLLDLRYAHAAKAFIKKIPIDKKDGILFAILLLLLLLTPLTVTRFTIFASFGYGYGSMTLQVAAAYVLTRPFAGKSPHRGEAVLNSDRNYIFISYAHSDIDRIKPYLKILAQKGYEFWYDDSIRTGTEWQGVIASNLANCTCFLAFISKASVESEYCLKEINYATSKKKPMAVIMLDDVMLPPVLEMHLASLQAVQRGKFGSDTDCMQKVFEMEQLDVCRY